MMVSKRLGSGVGMCLDRNGAKVPGAKKPFSRSFPDIGEDAGRQEPLLRFRTLRYGPSLCAALALGLALPLSAGLAGGCSRGVGSEANTGGNQSGAEMDDASDMSGGPSTEDLPKKTETDSEKSSEDDPESEPEDDANTDTGLPKNENSTAPKPSCDDGLKNGRETDIDCGGNECEACVNGDACRKNKDCKSGYCHEDGICKNKPSRCDDGEKNGEETDIDCGGSQCDPCELKQQCKIGSDCKSTFCKDGVCTKADCTTNEDCRNESYGPCLEGYCDMDSYKCRSRPTKEGQSCSTGKTCRENESCQRGECVGSPKDCSHLATLCDKASCNEQSGECEAQSLVMWKESFSVYDNTSNGWDTNKILSPTVWELGAASPSTGCYLRQDPRFDHTPTTDNNLIGTRIGGCMHRNSNEWDCVESPKIDLRRADDTATLRFWRYLSSGYFSMFQHRIMVRDASGQWKLVQEGYPQGIADSRWTELQFDVSPYRHADFQLSVCVRQSSPNQSSSLAPGGWSLDDFSIAPKECVVEQ